MWCGVRMCLGGSEGAREKMQRMSEEKDGVEEGARGTGIYCGCVVVLKDGLLWDKMCLFL
jgi:hypothetical protein